MLSLWFNSQDIGLESHYNSYFDNNDSVIGGGDGETVVVEVNGHKPIVALGPNRWNKWGDVGLLPLRCLCLWGLSIIVYSKLVIEFSQNTKILPSHVYDFITFLNVSMPMSYDLYFKLINQKICFIL